MRSRLVGFGLSAFFSLSACNGESIGGIGADSGPGSQPDASVDARADAPGDAQPGVCCPIDQERAGCMYLGGTSEADGASCARSCDFFCSESWRIEKDSNGCDSWRYDVRQPRPGEGPQCNPLDGGASSDGGSFACGTSSCDRATQYCSEDVPGPPGSTTTYACETIPSACSGPKTCECLQAAVSAQCQALGGLPTCTAQDGDVILACVHP